MIFNMTGGGNASLNFKVVGNPQPSNPSENTIWVNTDTEITSWHFCATEPVTYVEGTVWIQVGDSSDLEFNALKKNGIMSYPLFVKQYVGGSWVKKDAEIYNDGVWEYLWNGHLYRNGDEFESITGGWIPYKTSSSDTTAVNPTVTKSADSVKITIPSSEPYTKGGALVTKNPVSFKDKNTLVFTGSSTGEGNARCCIMVWSQMATDYNKYCVASYNFPSGGISNETVSIDVSSLDGDYYVGIYIYTSTHWIQMQQMKLE